jgi:hypothetical protein
MIAHARNRPADNRSDTMATTELANLILDNALIQQYAKRSRLSGGRSTATMMKRSTSKRRSPLSACLTRPRRRFALG